MARVMLCASGLSKIFWVEVLITACHIGNKVNLRLGTTMTPYEILNDRKPNLKYFHVFGCVCYILNDCDYCTKFDFKSDTAIFVGYSVNNHAYRVFNLRSKQIQESVNVFFYDHNTITKKMEEENVDGYIEKASSSSGLDSEQTTEQDTKSVSTEAEGENETQTE